MHGDILRIESFWFFNRRDETSRVDDGTALSSTFCDRDAQLHIFVFGDAAGGQQVYQDQGTGAGLGAGADGYGSARIGQVTQPLFIFGANITCLALLISLKSQAHAEA